MQGRIRGIRGFVGQLCGERRYVREIWPPSEWKGGISFCLGTLRGGRQWFESSAIFKLVGQGDLSKKAQKVQEDSRCKGIHGSKSKEEIKCVFLNARSIRKTK